MIVRPGQLRDAPQIAEIHVRSWQEAYAGIVPADYLASLSVERYEANWRENLAKGEPEVAVAVEGEAVLGWLGFGRSRDDDAAPVVAEIWAVYVNPSQWRRGVGRHLWEHAKRVLRERGFGSVTLWVLSENQRAAEFYAAVGFEIESSSKKHFDIGGRSLAEVRYTRRLDA